MTKTVKIAMIAAAVLSFVACNKEVEEAIIPSDKNVQLTFSSVKPDLTDVETRTVWDGETITWAKGDAIRIGYTVNDEWQAADGPATPAKLYASETLKEATEVAQFNVSASFNDTENAGLSNPVYKFYGIYPSGIAKADFNNPPILSITIPAEQTPAATSFDSSADIMYATSKEYSGIPSDRLVDLTWNRIVSHADISMRNLQVEDGETLESITVTAQAGADLVGAHTLNLTDGTVGGSGSNEVVVKATNLTFSDGAVEFWFTSLPFTATELTFTVKTNKFTYVRAFEGIELNFLGNARNTLSVNMKKAQKFQDYTEDFTDGIGEDFTTSGTDGIWKAGSYNGTYYMKASAYINKEHVVAESWLLSPYLTVLTEDSALTFEHSIDNHFGSLTDEATVWVRTKGGDWTQLTVAYPDIPQSSYSDFEPSTTSLGNYKGQIIQIGFKYIGTETNSGAWEIANFKVSSAEPKYYPSFAFTSETTAQVSFTATTVEFTYIAAHLESEPTVAIKAGSDDIIDGTPTIANGKITVNVKANADEVEKTATLVVTCEGVDNIPELVINQEAKSNLVETEATIDFTAMGFENAQVVTNVEQEPFTVSFTKGGNNDPKYYTSSGGSMRFYTGGTMTVSSEYTITKIVLTGTVAASIDGVAVSNRTWMGSSKAVVFTATGTNQIKTLTITYLAPGSAVTTYSVNIATGIQHGTVAAMPSSEITEGESVTLTITPDEGYKLQTLIVDDANVTSSVANNKYTFSMPAHNVAVSAAFEKQGETPVETIVYLTNSEITAALGATSTTTDSYGDLSIESNSGEWAANVNCKNTLTYLQLRNKTGSKLVSPVFSSSISKVVITPNKSKQTTSRTIHLVPSDTEVPTTTSNYGSTLWANQYGSVATGTTGADVTINFSEEATSFILVVEGGATYIDAIAIYLN